jgi:hypothetical protein
MRRRGWVAVVVLALVCAGCKVDATTTIALESDGSGTVGVRVRLDPEAVQVVERGGGTLEDRIVLDDLRDNGWRLASWERAANGSATLRLSHRFRDGNELSQVLAEMGGPNGVLRDARVIRTRNWLQKRDGVTLVVDLGALKSGVRDDEELANRLRAAGVDVDAVDFILAQQLRQAFSMRMTLAVPSGKRRTFTINEGERQTVNYSSSKFQTNRFALLLIGIMLVFLSLLLYLSASISARRRRSRALEYAAVRSRRGAQPLM